jgi:HTH-type transcriptional regulator/antitoxin HigA
VEIEVLIMTSVLRVARVDDYMKLVKQFPLRPIRSGSAHSRAKAMLRSLSGIRGSAVADYRMVLMSLIESYERDAGLRVDTSRLSAADVVRHLLKENGLSVNAFASRIGVAQSALSEMLNGKRDWSKSVIVRIADYFRIEPSIFLR